MKDYDQASLWINRTTTPYSSIDKYDVVDVPFLIMPDDKKSEYIKILEYSSYVELEEDEYLKLAKKNLEKKHGLAVRAVYAHSGGNFDVIRDYKNDCHIHYMVMGSKVWELHREILIIEADELPNEIFVSYSVVK